MFFNKELIANNVRVGLLFLVLIFPLSIYCQERNVSQPIIFESQNDSMDLSSNFYDLYTHIGYSHPSDEVYSHWNTNKIKYVNTEGEVVFDSIMLVLEDLTLDRTYTNPIKGPITSRFGPRWGRNHYGVDLDLNTGDSVRVAFDGQVRITTYDPGYGNVIVVRHENGLETVYGHLSKILVDTNMILKSGDIIALGGNTGRSTGSHLHFELRYLGVAINPESLIDFENYSLLKETIYLTEKNRLNSYNSQKAKTSSSYTKYYTIKNGDSLGKIASKNGTSISKLCKLNGIREGKILRPGQRLRVR